MIINTRFPVHSALLAALAVTLVHAQAQLITDGNFASGGTDWTATTTPPAGDAQFGNYNDNNWLSTPPPEGTTMAELGGAGNDSAVISQSLPSLTAGTYSLSFAWAGIAAYNSNWSEQVTFDSTVIGIRAQVTSGATVLFDTGFKSATQQTWLTTVENFNLVSPVNDAVIKISFQNTTYDTTGNHAYLGVSNVALQLQPLIKNGNFADGGTDWTTTTTPPFGDAQFGNYNSNGWLAFAPPVGTTMAELGGAGNDSAFLTQSLPSLPAGTYSLSLAWAGISYYNSSWASVTFDPAVIGIRAQVTSGATVLFDTGFKSAVQQVWSTTADNFNLVSPVNNAVIKISFQNTTYDTTGNHAYLGVSNVALQAVPSPYASWAAANVGGLTANLDYDSDGVSNGVEYFMNAASGFTANPGLVGNTVTWPNGGNIPSSAYGSQFQVQKSTDLANWSAVASDDITLSNTAGALTWKVASIANGDMGSFTGNLPSSWGVSGGNLTSASSADNSPFTNKFADNGNSWLIDDSTDAVGTAGFLQAFSNKTNYPSVEVNFDFKLTELTGGTWGIQFDGAGASAIAASSVHYRIDASGQFAINAGPGTGVITNILTLEADKWYNVRATFTTTAVNTGSNNGAGVQSGTITPEGGSPVSWSNVPLLNTSLGFSRLLVRDRDATFAGDLLLDNVSVAPQGKEFVRLKVTPN